MQPEDQDKAGRLIYKKNVSLQAEPREDHHFTDLLHPVLFTLWYFTLLFLDMCAYYY